MKPLWHIGVLALFVFSPMALLALEIHNNASAPALQNTDVIAACNNTAPMPRCGAGPVRRIPMGAGLFMADWENFLAY
jgi:hypothetical protein